MMKVKETEYKSDKTILKYLEHHVGIAVMLNVTGIEADSKGKKVVPAGTLVGNRINGVVSVVNNENTEGVLLHDTDVTYGNSQATMVIHGFIDATKIPEQPTDEALKALPMVKFL